MACAVLGNLEIKVSVNDLQFMKKRKNTNFPKLTKGPWRLYTRKRMAKRLKTKYKMAKFLTEKKSAIL